MKTLKKYVLGAALVSVAALTSCKDKMIELNTDQATLGESNPEYIFYSATRYMFYNDKAGFQKRIGGDNASPTSMARFMQYSAGYQAASRGYTTAQQLASGTAVSSPWPTNLYYDEYYTRAGLALDNLMDYLDVVIPEAERVQFQEIYSISKLIQTYLAWMQFDVYGAAIWTEAFKANEGIATPKYDLYNDVYKDLDAVVKEHVAILNATRPSTTRGLGVYDEFYGVKTTVAPTGGATMVATDALEARANWVRMGNTFRLKMAHRVNRMDNTHFEAVLAEVTNPANGGMMESKDHGWFIRYPFNWISDTNDGNQCNYYNRGALSFINSLQVMNDPRLPLLVRPNFNSSNFANSPDMKNTSGGYWTTYFYNWHFMKTYYPTLLATAGYLTAENNFFQGISNSDYAWSVGWPLADPAAARKQLRGNGGNYVRFGFTRASGAPQVGVWNNGVLMDETNSTPALDASGNQITAETWNCDVWSVSPFSGRYFVQDGGAAYDIYDRPKVGTEKTRMQRPILPYEEHCFRMALISVDKGGAAVGGKTAQQWYTEGITTAFQQLHEDALRTYVGIATSPNYPVIPGYNDAGIYDVTTRLATYLGSPAGTLSSTPETAYEQIGLQAWIAMFYLPEEAWAFWKQTGYPKFIDINPFQASDVVFPSEPGFELPKSSTNGDVVLARRATLPQPETSENITNYRNALEALRATEGYGTSEIDNSGRIWWDARNPSHQVSSTTVGY